MLDTTYCIPIPDCMPCDDVGVGPIDAAANPDEGYCCFNIPLFNNYAANFFDGINLCLLQPGTMTINNPFGSGWSTSSYTPTMIELDAIPPLGNFLPLGVFNLPRICIKRGSDPIQLLEIKWMNGDSILCRDTIEFFCEPDCGYIQDDTVLCNDDGSWNYSGLIVNTSGFTMGEAHVVFTSPPGLTNQIFTFPGGLPSGSSFAFILTLAAPAVAGDTVCFTVALHELQDSLHINCCNFYDCIVLPECPVRCVCDPDFEVLSIQGINCTILPTPPSTAVFSPGAILADCDLVVWHWSNTPLTDTTYGNASITHTFAGFGTFKACMEVRRIDLVNLVECKYFICKEIEFLPDLQIPIKLHIYPNPSGGRFNLTADRPWKASVQLSIVNLFGQQVKQWNIWDAAGTNQIPIEIPEPDKGVYLLEIRSEGKRWVKKVVIQ